MSEIHHECGVAAIYHFQRETPSPLCVEQGPGEISRLMPRMLQDIQNRGQLAAGITSFSPGRQQLIDTHKDIGSVSEVFRLSHSGKSESLMQEYAGHASIGHVRYATCGQEDRSYAQPFERHHLEKNKWFSFAFNGQLANYQQLRKEILSHTDFHLARETDTEILMHLLCQELSGGGKVRDDLREFLVDAMAYVAIATVCDVVVTGRSWASNVGVLGRNLHVLGRLVIARQDALAEAAKSLRRSTSAA